MWHNDKQADANLNPRLDCRLPISLSSNSTPFFIRLPLGLNPSPLTSKVSSAIARTFTVIWFLVRVPVLSEQITVVEPSVSTAFILLIIALCLAIFRIPNARVITKIIGNPSGTIATKIAMAIMNCSITKSKRLDVVFQEKISSKRTRRTATIKAIKPKNRPKLSNFNSSGVFGDSASAMSPAILPSSVFIPVSTTIPKPRPVDTVVPI